jgi:PTH1 family peptidyl-tRNA hydrolase
MGIGPLPANVDIIEFVLGRFEDQDEPVLKEMVERAASASVFYMSNGIDDVMNKYNK